jgi:hypothetical protein
MSRDSKQRILIHALELVGDREKLAKILGVRVVQIDGWLGGFGEIPDEQFLKAVDVCMDDHAPSLWDAPRSPRDLPPTK